MSQSIAIEGLSDALAALDALPDRITRMCVYEGVRIGAEALAARARELAPVAPPTTFNASRYGAVAGSLRASVKVNPPTYSGDWVNCKVSAGSKIAYYARWVEFGTAAHQIKPRYRKALTVEGGYAEVINHPGAQAHPFMRPAVDSAGQIAVEKFTQFVHRRIEVDNLSETTSS